MIPKFDNRKELHEWVLQHKKLVMQSKRATFKKADEISASIAPNVNVIANKSGDVNEADAPILVKSVINTTNLFDSHMDVHLPGLWKKSINESRGVYLLENHNWDFKNVISDNVKAYTQGYTWAELGYNYAGSTEALMFDSVVTPTENKAMYERYVNGKVKNHSVGMGYVKIFLAVDSTDKWFAEEKEIYDKYINEIANKSDVDDYGMFFAVTEAKLIEGSAVLMGSNWATPTMSIEEAAKSTPAPMPTNVTEEKAIDWEYIFKQLKN